MKSKPTLRKSPLWPALLSAFVAPGVGQFLNREYKKGILLLVSSIGAFLWFSKIIAQRLIQILPGPPEEWANNPTLLREAITKLSSESADMFLKFYLLLLLLWGFGVVDAYLSAKALKRAHHLDRDPSDPPH